MFTSLQIHAQSVLTADGQVVTTSRPYEKRLKAKNLTLIVLIGPHVLGKMIIDQKLEKLLGFKLFHNHMTIEIVAQFFSYSTPAGRELVNRIRQELFNPFCVSDAAGYIFTRVWAFSEASEPEYIEGINNQLRKTDIKRTG